MEARMPRHQNAGFTLVEVLIVVVIIAILAALIIPRLTIAPEKAKMAEGFQIIGTMHRAQQQYQDLTNTTGYLDISSGNGTRAPINPNNWTSLSLAIPEYKNYRYTCRASLPPLTNVCYAVRLVAGNDDPNNGYFGFDQNRTWFCYNGYVCPNGVTNQACAAGSMPCRWNQ